MSEITADNTIPMYYWSAERNFGDELSAAMVEWVSGASTRLVDTDYANKLIAVGSILERARNGDIVWGSGIHPTQHDRFWQKPIRKWYRKAPERHTEIDVWAVRGPLSRDALLCRGVPCPERFGDPGILTPLVYSKSRNPNRKLGLIPHFRDRHALGERDMHIINVHDNWRNVVDQIVQCDCIVSSSLHGIVVAEAYGVPAIWLRTLTGEGFVKYMDYYAGTGRVPQPVYSLTDALNVKTPAVPDLKRSQQELISSFDKTRLKRIQRKAAA
jgi:pyruvyltransferase